VRSRVDIARQRRRRPHGCWDYLIAAPLWPMHGANLGTLLRTCDAVGACLAVPRLPWVPDALARGNTLRRHACVHWTGRDVTSWLAAQRSAGSWVVGVELADGAVRLADLPAARRRTVAVLGHDQSGIPPEAIELLDVAVEIPMIGTGASLNVAVAGSFVLYPLARVPLRTPQVREGHARRGMTVRQMQRRGARRWLGCRRRQDCTYYYNRDMPDRTPDLQAAVERARLLELISTGELADYSPDMLFSSIGYQSRYWPD